MSTPCQYPPNPNTTNHCNDWYDHTDVINSVYVMTDFCTYLGPAGTKYRNQWCQALGSPGEWAVDTTIKPNLCKYNDCNPYQPLDQCCGVCCPILGGNVWCKRVEFNGDPLTCCINDKVCVDPIPGNPYTHTDAPNSCFSDPQKQDTCSPCHRDITSTATSNADGSHFTCADKGETGCQDIMLNYCSGADLPPGDISWTERWTNPNLSKVNQPPCIYALKRNIFNLPVIGCQSVNISLTNGAGLCEPIPIPMSAEGVVWGERLMSQVFRRYADDGFVLGSTPGTNGYNVFQDTIYQISCAVPSIVQQGLYHTCSPYTLDTLSRNPSAANFCGCYLPDSEYTTYVDKYQINKECTPTCNRYNSIPLVSGDGTPYRCNQSACIIDDIAINLVSTSVGNSGIGITQICGNCNASGPNSASACLCIINNNEIDAVDANIGGIDIKTQCTSSTCSIDNPNPGDGNPPSVLIPCSSLTNDPNADFYNQVAAINQQKRIAKDIENLTKVFIAFLVLGGLLLAFLLTGKRNR